jgi:transketolase
LKEGNDIAVFATGSLVAEALQAARILESENISVEVINVSTIKPLDEETLLKSAKKCSLVVTAEEHNKIGGLYSAISELISKYHNISVSYVAVEDVYGETGSWEDLLNKHKLNASGIVSSIKELIFQNNDNG